jgi:hypothetical protein
LPEIPRKGQIPRNRLRTKLLMTEAFRKMKPRESVPGQDHDDPGLEALPEEARAQKRAVPQQLPDGSHAEDGEGEADAGPEAVEDGGKQRVLRCEGLRPAKDDAVDHDEGNVGPQGLVNLEADGLHDVLGGRHEGRDDHDEGGDSHLGGNQSSQEGNHGVRENEDERRRQAHGERVHHGVRHREHGAHPQQVDEDRVLLPQRIEKGGQLRGGRRALG